MLTPLFQAGAGWLVDNIGLLAISLAFALTYLSVNFMKEGDTMENRIINSMFSIGSGYFISVAANTIPLT